MSAGWGRCRCRAQPRAPHSPPRTGGLARRRYPAAATAVLLAGCLSQADLTDVDFAGSYLLAESANVALNGSDQGAITVHLARGGGAPWVDTAISLQARGCTATPQSQRTNALGEAAFAIVCPQPQFVVVTGWAEVAGQPVLLQQQAALNVYVPSDGTRAVPPGSKVNVALVARDSADAVDMSWQGTVEVTSSDPAAILPADGPAPAAGVAYLAAAVTLNSLGAHTVSARDATSGRSLAELAFTVTRGTGQVAILAPPTTAVAGTPLLLQLRGQLDDGRPDPAFAHQVRLASSDANALLPPPYQFIGADAGSHILGGIVLRTAGAQTLTLTDQQTGAAQVLPVQVSPAPADTLAIGAPTRLTAGQGAAISLTACDAFGNVDASFAGDVALSIDDPAATLPATASLQPGQRGRLADAGTVVPRTSGRATISAHVIGRVEVAGSQQLLVGAGPATALSLTLPATATAGQPLSGIVAAIDALGNTADGYRGTVHFSATPPRTLLPGNTALSASNGGRRQLANAFVLYDAGLQPLGVADVAAPGMASLAQVAVAPAAASAVRVVSPATAVAGAAVDLTLEVVDPWGNRRDDFVGTMTLTASDPQVGLPAGPLAFAAPDAGLRVLPGAVTWQTAGPQALTASADGTSLTGSSSVLVSPGALSALAIEQLPASAVLTQPLSPLLRAVDAFANTVPTYQGVVSLTATPTATLPATVTFAAVDQGSRLLTHQLICPQINSYLIAASDGTVGGSATTDATHGCWRYGDTAKAADNNNSYAVGFVLDASHRPVVAATRGSRNNNAVLQVLAFDGSGWAPLGALPPTLPETESNLLRVGPGNALYLVSAPDYGDGEGAESAYAMRLVAGAWQPLSGPGGQLQLPALAHPSRGRLGLDLAIDAGGQPWLASVTDAGGPRDVSVTIFDGSAWQPAPAGGTLGLAGEARIPNIQVPASGLPIIAVDSTAPGNHDILVTAQATVSGSPAWRGPASGAAYDNVSANPGTSTFPILALAADGSPTVAWMDDSSGSNQVYLRRLSGGVWEELGGSASGTGVSAASSYAGQPGLTMDAGGNPWVSWTSDGRLRLRRWDGSAWVEVNGSDSGDGLGYCNEASPVTTFDQDGNLVVLKLAGSIAEVCNWR